VIWMNFPKWSFPRRIIFPNTISLVDDLMSYNKSGWFEIIRMVDKSFEYDWFEMIYLVWIIWSMYCCTLDPSQNTCWLLSYDEWNSNMTISTNVYRIRARNAKDKYKW
jgi:hypothetical protein